MRSRVYDDIEPGSSFPWPIIDRAALREREHALVARRADPRDSEHTYRGCEHDHDLVEFGYKPAILAVAVD